MLVSGSDSDRIVVYAAERVLTDGGTHMGRRAKYWCATGWNFEIMSYIWEYDRKFGYPPTIREVAVAAKESSLDEIMRDLRIAEEAGWIALHLEDEQEIEILCPLSETAGMANRSVISWRNGSA